MTRQAFKKCKICWQPGSMSESLIKTIFLPSNVVGTNSRSEFCRNCPRCWASLAILHPGEQPYSSASWRVPVKFGLKTGAGLPSLCTTRCLSPMPTGVGTSNWPFSERAGNAHISAQSWRGLGQTEWVGHGTMHICLCTNPTAEVPIPNINLVFFFKPIL